MTLGTLSCEKEIEIDQTRIKPKMVVNAVLDPGSAYVLLDLSESRDMLFDLQEFPHITNAIVKLYEEGVLVAELTENESEEFYYLDYQVEAGKTYKLIVEHNDFDNVEAITRVPFPGQIGLVTMERHENLKVDLEVSVEDYQHEANFYAISVLRRDTLIDTTGLFFDNMYNQYQKYVYNLNYACTNDEAIEYPEYDVIEGRNCSNDFYLTDEKFLNSSRVFSMYSEIYYPYYEVSELYTEAIVTLSSFSEEYYKYLISRDLFLYSESVFSEPVKIYTNVINGFGIFGAKSAVSAKISEG